MSPVRIAIPESDAEDKLVPEISAFEKLTPLKFAFPSVRLSNRIPGPAKNLPIKLSVIMLYPYCFRSRPSGADNIRTGAPVLPKK